MVKSQRCGAAKAGTMGHRKRVYREKKGETGVS